ncbi:putative secreted protein [Lysobacter dokdonensis DS-58]|uniref:Putative secreted protein n=2 Tax=Noviluteimonas TaxID=3382693 RepID=A0A0A2WEI7_9GAMM|nr:putative secreted protein [Lysobacter dokdonensis DS-58]
MFRGAVACTLVAAAVGFAVWGLRAEFAGEAVRAPVSQIPAETGLPTLRLESGGQGIHLDAAMARRALRDGTLEVVLPDGTAYPVKIERQETHGGGHWSLVGRVQTAVGAQSMVLTFGGNAVFGQVPMPDGHAMQIETEGNGLITVAPARNLVPRSQPGRPATPDYRVPPGGEFDTQYFKAVADQPLRLDDGKPVRIDVLALYSPELVARRGSVAAAKTQIAHLIAVANQAHRDSGTRVRLHMIGAQEVAIPADLTNAQALDVLTAGRYGDIDFEALRDKTAADLAAFIRPVSETDDTCGASWLNGAHEQGEAGLDPAHGYVVANVSPCGAYVLAHEIGHAMGAAHDIAAQTDADGVVTYGAYPFSFDLRTPMFGTLMTDPGEGRWIGRFSNPHPTACDGAPCGVAGRIDNARGIDLAAPAVARFRDPPTRN